MSDRIVVLQVIQNLNYGGMERLLNDIARSVDSSRFESHVLCLQYLGRFAEGLEGHVVVHQADPMPKISMFWPAALVEQIRQIGPDVVHTHSGVWHKVSLAARLAGIRHLVHTEHGGHNSDGLVARLLDRASSRRTHAVVAVSEEIAHRLRTSIHVDPRKLRIVHNGVDTNAIRPLPDDLSLRSELGISSTAPIIGSIGRLEPIKGYDVMISAFAELRRCWGHGEAPVLVVAGEGSERPALTEMIVTRGLTGSAYLLGWRDDLETLHRAFTLFTLSSRSEGTSVGLLEAMAAGRCPVVTHVGGNRNVLGPPLRHHLVPSENPAALAAAWMDCLRNDARRSEDARSARKRVEQRFRLDEMILVYEDLYSAVSEHAPTPLGGNGRPH